MISRHLDHVTELYGFDVSRHCIVEGQRFTIRVKTTGSTAEAAAVRFFAMLDRSGGGDIQQLRADRMRLVGGVSTWQIIWDGTWHKGSRFVYRPEQWHYLQLFFGKGGGERFRADLRVADEKGCSAAPHRPSRAAR